MGYFYHAIPVNGGLQVPAENLEELITKINEAHEGSSDAWRSFSRADDSQAMEELRRRGFYIHQGRKTE